MSQTLSGQSTQHHLLPHPDLPSFPESISLEFMYSHTSSSFTTVWRPLLNYVVTSSCVHGHLALWKNGVHHRDISPSKLMYYRDKNGNIAGVLIDFDLTSSGGAQRITGAASFMALDLLTKPALRGEAQHLYEHDAESFIWVLAWISLRYSDGKPLKNTELDKWLRVDAVTCGEKKWAFLFQSGSLHRNKAYPPGEGHEHHLEIVQAYLVSIQLIQSIHAASSLELQRRSRRAERTGQSMVLEKAQPEKPETVFKKFFVDPIDVEDWGSVFVGMNWVEDFVGSTRN
ncbi:hypothetical protein F5I97DRAFT_1932369 [Phlebopus sp. FC_14]|nr:hypothetical protein F5I97DRAFT_1932369 [Phlebopus sp. FC_14]